MKKVFPALAAVAALALAWVPALRAQSLDVPSKTWGLSIGNSQEFTGLRFNFRDSRVRRITGVNITFWQPKKDNKDSVVRGLSLGVIPGGGDMKGLQLGVLGPAADKRMTGINIGLVGAGCGESMTGLNIGGIGLGAGENVTGINLGGVGAGAGKSMVGLNVGGVGVGAGEDLAGISLGGLGAGAGENLVGLAIGGLGVGA